MANIQIIQGDFEKKLKLQFAPGIKAGFPSPAEDYSHETLDFNRDLIRKSCWNIGTTEHCNKFVQLFSGSNKKRASQSLRSSFCKILRQCIISPHYALCIMNYALVKAVHAPCNL